MSPTREDVVAAARKLWGDENKSLSSKDELRFGSHGSKSLNLKDLTWYDHEAEEGGGWKELFEMSGVKPDMENGSSSSWIFYDYRDEKGQLIFQVVRQPGHKFVQRRPDPNKPGEWVWKTKGVRRVLYRLPQLIASTAAEPVFVCEGEKDADNLARLGCVTTTNPGGAGKWRREYGAFLHDRTIVILPDNDVAGIAHAAEVKRHLKDYSKRVSILYLPGLTAKGNDVTDWINAGGTADKLFELFANPPPPPEPPEPPKKSPPDGGEGNGHWITRVQFGRDDPLSNVANVLLALRDDERLKSMLAYDQMLRHPMIVKSEPTPLKDEDITDIQEYLQLAGLRRVGKEVTTQGIVRRCKESGYHPLRAFLEGLAWDGEPRNDTWALTYLGAADTPYNRAIGAMFLRQMVARIFQPGCKADYMLVLEGEQGVEKSEACKVLFGPKYFSDSCPDLGKGKEVSQHLRGKWGVEFPEMHLYSRADIDAHKEFMTRTHERYRPPYEAAEVEEPRQCVFIGTSNKEVYLRDETGNRRYWGLACGKIDLDRLKTNRDQLLAEAVQEYRNAVPWWPDREFEREHIRPEQEARFERDIWHDRVVSFITGKSAVTVEQIATASDELAVSDRGLGIPVGRLGRADQMRIAAILRKEGWFLRRSSKTRWWYPPGHGDDLL